MKYLNGFVFLGLMLFVAGCQKKEQPQPKKNVDKVAVKDSKVKKQGPTKLETKKSAAVKHDDKKVVAQKSQPAKKAHDLKKAAPKKVEAKKDVKKSKNDGKKS